jgi:hypothetical protein
MDCPKKISKENYKECVDAGHVIHLAMDTCKKCPANKSYANVHLTPLDHPRVKTDKKILQQCNDIFHKVEEHNFDLCFECI